MRTIREGSTESIFTHFVFCQGSCASAGKETPPFIHPHPQMDSGFRRNDDKTEPPLRDPGAHTSAVFTLRRREAPPPARRLGARDAVEHEPPCRHRHQDEREAYRHRLLKRRGAPGVLRRRAGRFFPGRGRLLRRGDVGQPDEGNRHHPRHEEDGQYQAREVKTKHCPANLHHRHEARGRRREGEVWMMQSLMKPPEPEYKGPGRGNPPLRQRGRSPGAFLVIGARAVFVLSEMW